MQGFKVCSKKRQTPFKQGETIKTGVPRRDFQYGSSKQCSI